MLHDLTTEQQNPLSESIDALPTEQMLLVINRADSEITAAVHQEIPNIARAIDAIAGRIERGGRLFYTGAGTSGRLGVLDASECPPTFNTPPELVQGIIAGGDRALRYPIERAEDDPQAGERDLVEHDFSARDALVGIAASGRTPYVLGGLGYARRLGALAVGLSCTSDSEVAAAAEIAITPVPGAEIITGSTRMRAGTATKLVLNMISTGVMVRLGYVYGNLMVNMQPSNAKLADRSRRIVSQIAKVSDAEAAALLEAAGGSIRIAVLMGEHEMSRVEAETALNQAKGSLRQALAALGNKRRDSTGIDG